MRPRGIIVVEVGRRRVRALWGRAGRGSTAVQGSILLGIPAEIDVADAAALGAWLGSALDEAGAPRGSASAILGRGAVVVKRLALPTREANELPEMTRLALLRDVHFTADQAVIDFVPVEQGETSTTVLAVAAPRDACDALRATLAAAGRRLEHIGLRTMGVAALFAADEGAALAIEVGTEGIEFAVVVGGSVHFSRGAELPDGVDGDVEALADAVRTETRRTWMSYRMVEGSIEVDHAWIVAGPAIASAAAEAARRALDCPVRIFERHEAIEGSTESAALAWPLAGAMLERACAIPTIDLASPRRAVDRAAERRRLVLMGAALLVVVAGILWTLGRRDLDARRTELARVEGERAELYGSDCIAVRERLRLRHVEQWASVRPDWLGHMDLFARMMPGPDQVVLDSWLGSLEFRGAVYDEDARTWSAPARLSIAVEGEASDRAVADSLRGLLVADDRYVASATGSETEGGKRLPDGFTWRLVTDDLAPVPAPAEEVP